MNKAALPAIRDPEACADPYRVALDRLRRLTKAPTRPLFEVLLRAALIHRGVGRALLNQPLRTKGERREAIIAAAAAIGAERDDREAAA